MHRRADVSQEVIRWMRFAALRCISVLSIFVYTIYCTPTWSWPWQQQWCYNFIHYLFSTSSSSKAASSSVSQSVFQSWPISISGCSVVVWGLPEAALLERLVTYLQSLVVVRVRSLPLPTLPWSSRLVRPWLKFSVYKLGVFGVQLYFMSLFLVYCLSVLYCKFDVDIDTNNKTNNRTNPFQYITQCFSPEP